MVENETLVEEVKPAEKKEKSLVVRGRGTTNIIKGRNNPRVVKRASVRFLGVNNTLIIGAGVNMVDVRVLFNGNDSVIEIGPRCKINGSLIVKSGSRISIGAGTKFNSQEARVHCGEPGTSIVIGKKCLLASVRFRTSDQHAIYDVASDERINPAKDIVVEDDVWIAENVYVYKGVTIGAGSVVGARSTVLKSLPGGCLCVGTPAQSVREGIYWKDKFE
ncbi:acyltransferase [Salinicola sp. CPA57]|uniref:acyltransferase n=1 Tax=Salinicola sp. CPA57 TaxID=1949080 RepID=UPI000DA167D5|nr:acyltransferase [Salinicola sp. CPA57]